MLKKRIHLQFCKKSRVYFVGTCTHDLRPTSNSMQKAGFLPVGSVSELFPTAPTLQQMFQEFFTLSHDILFLEEQAVYIGNVLLVQQPPTHHNEAVLATLESSRPE